MTITLYIKNMLGFQLSDDQMRTITCPKLEVVSHVTLRCAQAFSIIGCLVVAPSCQAYYGARTMQTIFQSSINGGIKGAALGAVVGPFLALARLNSQTEDSIYDRAYRLRYNRNQVRVDRGWIAGSSIGPAIAVYGVGATPISGFVVGGISAVFLTAMYNNVGGAGAEKKD